ncbi:MAG: hypothetical protein DWP97_03845 [Calditrichaeota bacterium]|nr:MAG: hypothetical protein DWP97_03845 [Calditrichota bacterium]
MKRIATILLVLFSVSLAIADDSDNIKESQEELKKIYKDLEKTEKKLDKLHQKEVDIQKQISESNQKINIDKKVIRQLKNELKNIQGEISDTESEVQNRNLQLELTERRFLGNVRQFYLTAHKPTESFSENPNEELKLNKQIIYLTSLAEYESGNVDLAKELLAESEQKKSALHDESKEVERMKRKKETSFSLAASIKKKKERELEKTQREKLSESDKFMTLKQAADEMESIVQRLMDEAAQRERAGNQRVSFFAELKGTLLAPYKGKIIESWGDKINPITNLRSTSPGIKIKGTPGRKVSSVSSGTIAYVGELRGYGNFIIINHDDRFFTTYAGLGSVSVTTDQYVLGGEKLGVSDSNGIIKFEIRDNRKTVDPVEWIQIDSFQ